MKLQQTITPFLFAIFLGIKLEQRMVSRFSLLLLFHLEFPSFSQIIFSIQEDMASFLLMNMNMIMNEMQQKSVLLNQIMTTREIRLLL